MTTHRRHTLWAADYQAEADAWIRANPSAFAAFVGICADHLRLGQRFGAKGVAERLRWDPRFETARRASLQPGGFAINNNHVSYILRRVIDQLPEVAALVTLRKAHRCIAGDAARAVHRRTG